MNENFLLTSETARRLYFDTAQNLPIIDYHNHLSVDDLTADRHFADLTELWISPDPYKHRAMRICGIEEKYITGNADHYTKYLKWCETLPQLVGNPLYIWSHMELQRIFGITETLNLSNAEKIWQQANEMLKHKDFTNNNILNRFHVRYSSPCCLLTDSVEFFLSQENFAPSLRGDNLIQPTLALIMTLSKLTGLHIDSLDSFFAAVNMRLDYFDTAGCRFADHALDNGFHYFSDDGHNEKRFQAILLGSTLDKYDMQLLASYILKKLMCLYTAHHYTLLLHIGAQRKTSERLAELAGPNGGYAAVGAPCDIDSLIMLLGDAEKDGLPKTVLFPLNPADSTVMSVLSGSFSEDNIRAKIQQGPAWWWCDHIFGIRNVLENISAYSVLSTFIGMTTDSRSILSFVRHEYFRRMLCSWIGEKVALGEFPEDMDLLADIVQKICCGNAAELI